MKVATIQLEFLIQLSAQLFANLLHSIFTSSSFLSSSSPLLLGHPLRQYPCPVQEYPHASYLGPRPHSLPQLSRQMEVQAAGLVRFASSASATSSAPRIDLGRWKSASCILSTTLPRIELRVRRRGYGGVSNPEVRDEVSTVITRATPVEQRY